MAEILSDVFKVGGTAIGAAFGGPAGAAIGGAAGSALGSMFEQTPQNNNSFDRFGKNLTSRVQKSQADIQRAFDEAINITKPGFKQAGQNIQTLLSEARKQFEPLQNQPQAYQQTLADVLSGERDITDLPQFQAQSQAIKNVLGFTGQTQSPTGTAFAFQPLISDVFSQIQTGAQQERAEMGQTARSLASLFSTEAGLMGQLPIQEAQTVSGLTTESATRTAQMDQSLNNLLLGVEQLSEGQRTRQSEAEAKTLAGLFGLGKEIFFPEEGDLSDFFSDIFGGAE